jgi:tetratricopeptide (TPR) repeat protein
VTTPESPDGGIHVHATTSGSGRSYVVGQGTLIVNEAYGRSAAAAVTPVAASTDAAPVVFVGRGREAAQLLGWLDPTVAGPVTMVVSALAGLAGVGKSALARHAAGLAVGRGWFPGGAWWVDLRGYDEVPVAAARVYAPLLRAFGIEGDRIPASVDEQATVYHHVLAARAEQGRPVLLVFDNAGEAGQVAELLPTHRAHRVLVTSRHTLGELEAVRLLDLAVLDPEAASRLLDEVLRQRDPGDQRVARELATAAELAELCGQLPLALRITAALLAEDHSMAVADLVGELADETTRLDKLAYGQSAVAAAFDLSLRHLAARDRQAADVFRLLPANPGPELSTEAVGALTGLPASRAAGHLRVLRRAHLLEPGSAADRWRLHDLVLLYARRLATPAERQPAVEQLLRFYTATAKQANDRFIALPGDPVPARFADLNEALAWLDTEYANLVAAVDLAADTGDQATAATLPGHLAEFFRRRRYLAHWLATASTAAAAAGHLDDLHAKAWASSNLGTALTSVRRFDEAVAAHQQAIDFHRATGDRHDEGMALTDLGNALAGVRRFEEAVAAHQQAAALLRRTGDRRGVGIALTNLAHVLFELRRFDEAVTATTADVAICHELGDRNGEATALNNLGSGLRELGRLDEAIAAHQQAVEIHRVTGDRYGEGFALNNLGVALTLAGRLDEAIATHQQNLALCRQTGEKHRKGQAYNMLGSALLESGRIDEAITAHQQAVDCYRDTGDRHGEGKALVNLSIALHRAQRFTEAITASEHAIDIHAAIGDRHGEGLAHNCLGGACHVLGRLDEAVRAFEQAVRLHQDSGDRRTEQTALTNLGNVHRDAGRFDHAATAFEQAINILRDIGDHHGEALAAADLGTLQHLAGRTANGIATLRRAVTLLHQAGDTHHEGLAWISLGEILHQTGRLDTAVTTLQHAAEVLRTAGDLPGESLACNNLAGTLAAAGRLDEAIVIYHRDLAICEQTNDRRNEGTTRSALGAVLHQVGQTMEAREQWILALKAFIEVGAKDEAARVRTFIMLASAP